ncbi:DUF2333 family protein [Psychromonas sp. SP041]|uniref:DUF2333 family protein n=1 Tax=Psychromonas sp. SP041 TaxID=1365007 RepID=UPI00041851E5|nr:DUF2333 family protein [Psychromonas sp. SP041]
MDQIKETNLLKKAVKVILIASIPLLVILDFAWVTYVSTPPKSLQVSEILENEGVSNANDIIGEATTSAFIYTVDAILNKDGGYTANDLLVKAGNFDNMPSFERGVVAQAREIGYALRDRFSRGNSNDRANPDLTQMQPLINFSDEAWYPIADSEMNYKKAVKHARNYLKDITTPQENKAKFFARADSLEKYFDKVSQRLGDLTQQLSASSGDVRENTDLANDASASQSSASQSVVYAKTPWLEIDNVFWKAKGEAWALIHYMRGIQIDFESVLNDKNAMPTVKQIIRELEKTQLDFTSFVVLNGNGRGVTANYSLYLSNSISRAKSSIQELQKILNNG